MFHQVFVLLTRFRDLVRQEDGQDLVEYALVVALISLASTVAVQAFAVDIGNGYNFISTKFTSTV